MALRLQLLPLITLIVVNIIPIFGVFWLDWNAGKVIVLYWAENLVVAFYTIIKIAVAPVARSSQHFKKLGTIAFFMLHYGGFVAVHGVFVLSFIGQEPDAFAGVESVKFLGPLIFFVLMINVIEHMINVMPAYMLLPLAGLFFSHGLSFVQIHFRQQEYLEKTPKQLMSQPYKRMLVMHIALIAAGFFIIQKGSPLPLMIILIALKIGLDVFLHFRSHRHTAYKEYSKAIEQISG